MVSQRPNYRKWSKNVINFIVLYFNNCCVHGFRFVVETMLLLFERFLWLVLLVVSIYFCIVVCLSSVDRYYTKSTHIGVERNYHFWNTTIPSLTVCPATRLNVTYFADYCRQMGIKGSKKDTLWDFLENLANSTYTNFQNIPENAEIDEIIKEIDLKPKQYMELIYNLTYDRTYDPNERQRTRCFDGATKIHARQVLTEWGLCYLTNSELGKDYSARYFIFGKYPEPNTFELASNTVDFMFGTYFSMDMQYTFLGFSSDAIFSFAHSAFDVMKVDASFGYATEGVTYELTSREVISEENLENETTVTMRKCRFYHETNLTHFPFYTRNICLQECRINLAYKICKCIPHFYPNRISNPKRVCDYKTLRSCFPRHESYFLQLYESDRKEESQFPCYCEQNCRDSVVTIRSAHQMSGSKQLLGGVGTSVQVRSWPKSRLKRQVIFSMTDLLVSIGGTAGLFLGFSVLGFVEILYFFTMRLFWQILGYKL
ncbi:sodium channel protein Nach-like [Drosophila ficusphila]|uniref:sodium channel protein Nach-like n=1 Tax=Drosophila ficusphila TaxID=30025 RepID=UPI0007E74E05|nr:sodium channel protein Nach-like [Drosophila ficusphila]